MKKQILSVLLAIAILSSAACRNSKDQTTKASSIVSSEISKIETTSEQKPATSEAPSETTAATETSETTTSASVLTTLSNQTNREKNQFDLNIKLDDTNKTLKVDQKLKYVNNTGKDLKEIYFNLIPEAFREKNGGVTIDSVSCGGQTLSMKQIDGTVYSLPLASELKAGASIDIDMSYTVKIPNIADRFGYSDNLFNLGNVIATPALFENGAWLVQPYIDIGDAFYTEIADYTATFDVPEGFTVASTGTMKVGKYVAENVRDFAFSIGKDMKEIHDTEDGVNIQVFYNGKEDSCAEYSLEVAKKAVKFYNSVLGGYPYETLNIVLCQYINAKGAIAMEYPQLVMIGTLPDTEVSFEMDLGKITLDEARKKIDENDPEPQPGDKPIPLTDEELLSMLKSSTETHAANIVHEIAHQWFYGIVGNDEIRHPWIDEGMTDFMEAYCLTECNLIEDAYQMRAFQREDEDIMNSKDSSADKENFCDLNKSIYDYKKDEMEYWSIYDKGAALMYHFYQSLGKDAFNQALKEYVETFAYTEVTPQEFQEFWKTKGDFEETLKIYLASSNK